MKKILFLLSALILVRLSSFYCSNKVCMRYDKDVASFAVHYAACSNLPNQYVGQLKEWNSKPCILAQTKKKIADVSAVIEKEKNLLAYTAYDKERNIIVLAFRGTICGNNRSNFWLDTKIFPKNYVNT